MAFDHRSLLEAKKAVMRMKDRIGKVREDNERVIGQGLQVVEAGAAMFGWGWANHKFGTVPAHDAAALPEVQVLGLPADLGAGVLLVGAAMFGAFGRYDEHAINVGAGSIGAFGYRMGAEIGSKSHESAPAAPGRRPAGQVTSGAHGHRRIHNVVDEREEVAA